MSKSTVKAGQQFDAETGDLFPFLEWEQDYGADAAVKTSGLEGQPAHELSPSDTNAQKVRKWDLIAIQATLAATTFSHHINIDYLRLPDTLRSITAVVSKSHGDGSDSTPASQIAITANGDANWSASPSAQAQGSASVLVDLSINIEENNAENVPAQVIAFYVAEGTSRADLLTKIKNGLGLSTVVHEWPKWGRKMETLIVQSNRVSVSVKASTRIFGGGTILNNSTGYEWGNGASYDIDLNLKAIRISPTIHGAMNINGLTELTETASATVDASVPAVATLGAIPNTRTATKDAVGAVTPTSLTGTDVDEIPSTGFYLYNLTPGPTKFGMLMYQAVVIDFTYFA